MGYSVVTVANTATKIVGYNAKRLSLVMTNSGATVYYGPDSSISAKNCPHIISDGTFAEDGSGHSVYKGDIYGICSAGTSTVYYWEREGNL